MTNNCLNPKCQKELAHVEGRRKKQYCSSTCKSLVWYENHKDYMKVYRENAKKKKELKFQKATKKGKAVVFNSTVNYKIPDESSYDGKRLDNYTLDEPSQWQESKQKIPRTLDELKALCPHTDPDEKRLWIATERQKYNI